MHLGIDLGGTKIETVVLDRHSKERYRKRVASPRNRYDDTLACLQQQIQDAERHVGQTCTLGIGIPGAISPDTRTVKNANSTWLIGHPLQQDLEERLGRPVVIANDADCFTLSEAIDGAGKDDGVVFGVILGTGVGGGISVRKQVLAGPNRIAGEWGHNPLPWLTPADALHDCYCGKQGCIETFLSGPGFAKHYQASSGQTVTAPLPSSEEILKRAQQGEAAAKRSLEDYQDRLARALSTVVNILDPDCIVLGGGMSNIEGLLNGLHDAMQAYVFSDTLHTRIVTAEHGDASGVRGAAWLGRDQSGIQYDP